MGGGDERYCNTADGMFIPASFPGAGRVCMYMAGSLTLTRCSLAPPRRTSKRSAQTSFSLRPDSAQTALVPLISASSAMFGKARLLIRWLRKGKSSCWRKASMVLGPADHTHHRFYRNSGGRRPAEAHVAPPVIEVELRHAIRAVRFEVGLEDFFPGHVSLNFGISIVRGRRTISRF